MNQSRAKEFVDGCALVVESVVGKIVIKTKLVVKLLVQMFCRMNY